MGSQGKRSHTDDDEQELPSPPSLSQAQVDALVAGHRDALVTNCCNEKDTERKAKLRSAINSFCDAFHKISNVYTSLLTSGNTVKAFQNDLSRVLDCVESSWASLENISETVTNVVSVQENTYASVTKSSAQRSSANLRNRMVLKNGKTLPIRSDSQMVVGPSDTSTEIYDSSAATKAKFLEIMKPTEIGLRINRILLSANK